MGWFSGVGRGGEEEDRTMNQKNPACTDSSWNENGIKVKMVAEGANCVSVEVVSVSGVVRKG